MFLGLVVWTSPSLTVNPAGGSGGALGKTPNGLSATRHCGTCPDVVKIFFLRKRAFFALHTAMTKAIPISIHVYEVRPRKDKRGVDLISDALPFGRLWYGEPNAVANATGYAKHGSRSHDAVIRVYDQAGNVIETHEHAGDFRKP